MPDRVNVIWCDGKNSFRKYFYDEEPQTDRDLRMVVAGATGVSSGTAHVVLVLLMEEIAGHRLTDLIDLSYVGSEAVNGEECHHLHHSVRNSHIWVSKRRYVLLRMADHYSIESGSSARRAGDESGMARADDGDKEHVSVSRKTTYCDLITDSEIPDTVFSLDGPPRNF